MTQSKTKTTSRRSSLLTSRQRSRLLDLLHDYRDGGGVWEPHLAMFHYVEHLLYPPKCAIPECPNRRNKMFFVGQLCGPCFDAALKARIELNQKSTR